MLCCDNGQRPWAKTCWNSANFAIATPELTPAQCGTGAISFMLLPTTMQPNPGRIGILIVDRPEAADPGRLAQIEATFGPYQLVPITATGERGIVCRMQVEPARCIYSHVRPTKRPTFKRR